MVYYAATENATTGWTLKNITVSESSHKGHIFYASIYMS